MTQIDNFICMSILNYKLFCSTYEHNILEDEKYMGIFNESEKQSMLQIGIDNQSSLISTLYNLFVIPYEKLLKPQNMLTDFENVLKENCFILTNKHKKQELNYHLRNGLAHAHIEFTNNNVIFTDIKPTDTTQICEFTMTLNQLKTFVDFLVNYLTTYLNKKYHNI